MVETKFKLIPDNLPEKIDVEPTINCNFGCTMCQRTYWTRSAPDMSLKQFIHIYNAFPRLTQLKLQGIGEPLLNRDFFKMVAYAATRGTSVTSFSNGSVLHINDNAKKVLDSGLDLIRISMDGATRETFQAIRAKSNFEQVLANVSELVRLRGERREPKIEFWTVGMVQNVHELKGIIELAHSIGVDRLHLQMIINTFDYKDEVGSRLLEHRMSQIDGVSDLVAEAISYAKGLDFDFALATSKSYSRQRKCHWAFDTAFISVEGYVVPCCTIADPRIINMGNLHEESLDLIWTGQRYQQFRATILEHNLLSPCRNCYSDEYKRLIPDNNVI